MIRARAADLEAERERERQRDRAAIWLQNECGPITNELLSEGSRWMT